MQTSDINQYTYCYVPEYQKFINENVYDSNFYDQKSFDEQRSYNQQLYSQRSYEQQAYENQLSYNQNQYIALVETNNSPYLSSNLIDSNHEQNTIPTVITLPSKRSCFCSII